MSQRGRKKQGHPAKANIDLDIAFPPSEPQPAQFLPERRDLGLCGRIALGIPHHHADAPQAIELLRPRRERPRRCAAEQCYEIAPGSEAVRLCTSALKLT